MEELDLTSISCPMALLLAKRAVHGLAVNQCLHISIADSGSRRDILRYLYAQRFDVHIMMDSIDKLVIQVSKDTH